MTRSPAPRTATVLGLALALSSGAVLLAAPAQAVVNPPIPIVPDVCPVNWTNVIVGSNSDDSLVGTDGNDLIVGLGGRDVIYGGGGRDTILGGDGNDVIAGGPGDDCILGGAGDDDSVLFMFTQQNGNDTSSSVTYRYQY
jgi:Ca2+-binding RTX toxin-like protein